MDSFTKGIEQLAGAKAARELEPAVDVARALSREQLAGAAFVSGDRVVDRVTKKGGTVVLVSFARDARPSAGR